MLPLTAPTTSKYRLMYRGPVGVAGVNVQQFFDLSALPDHVRRLPTFRDNFRVFVRQVDVGISDVSEVIDFFPPVGIPDSMILTLTAVNPGNEINVEVWFVHSAVR